MIRFLLLVLCVLPVALFAESAQAVNFDSSAQENIIAGALKQYYSINGDFEVTAVTPLASLAIAPTSVELLEVPPSPASTMVIRARYLNGKEKIGEISGAFKAQWRTNVFVPRKQLARGSVLSPSDFEIQNVDRLTLKQVPVDTSLNLAEYEMISSLSAGTALTWNCIKSQPLVRKGALVDVIVQDGGLKITTRAIAMHDACRGEQVAMRNTTTNRQFEAYVINENLVQLRF